jgi:hypothetical protein
VRDRATFSPGGREFFIRRFEDGFSTFSGDCLAEAAPAVIENAPLGVTSWADFRRATGASALCRNMCVKSILKPSAVSGSRRPEYV